MYAKSIVRTLVAVGCLAGGLPAVAAADDCLCTQRVDFRTADGSHDWSVTADASGALKVTLALEITTTNTGQVNADQLNATIYTAAGAPLHTIAIAGATEGWVRGDFTVTPTVPGEVYRVEITRAVPHPTPNHASRYWLRLDGAVDAAIDGPLQSLNGGRTTWTLHADAGDAMHVRLYDPFTYPIDPGTYPVMYQWIAPDGATQPIGTYTVVGPGMDTTIPPPTALVPGKWRLRLQTLSFGGTGWGYGIEKISGSDRRLHVEPAQAGLGLGGTVRFVDQNGDPFTAPVDFTFGFGESFTFPIPGGAFVNNRPGDVFPIPVSLTPPAGFVASPASFFFLMPCDGFFEQTVVISPAPPALTVTLSPNVLWPPNNKMVTIDATVTASDGATVELVSITSSEPNGAADIGGASPGTDDRAFELRAQRLGGGGGRTYTITYRATSAAGVPTTVSAAVVVPHDQRK